MEVINALGKGDDVAVVLGRRDGECCVLLVATASQLLERVASLILVVGKGGRNNSVGIMGGFGGVVSSGDLVGSSFS